MFTLVSFPVQTYLLLRVRWCVKKKNTDKNVIRLQNIGFKWCLDLNTLLQKIQT